MVADRPTRRQAKRGIVGPKLERGQGMVTIQAGRAGCPRAVSEAELRAASRTPRRAVQYRAAGGLSTDSAMNSSRSLVQAVTAASARPEKRRLIPGIRGSPEAFADHPNVEQKEHQGNEEFTNEITGLGQPLPRVIIASTRSRIPTVARMASLRSGARLPALRHLRLVLFKNSVSDLSPQRDAQRFRAATAR
jgi:hypothetical protein